MGIKYNIETIAFLNLFEKITKARVKDCFLNSDLIFIVNQGEVGKAIGKGGINIKNLEKKIRKRIKIVEFNQNPVIFIKNFIAPLAAKEIIKEEDIIKIIPDNIKTKGLLIGRDRKNLKRLQGIVSKYFNIEIKVL